MFKEFFKKIFGKKEEPKVEVAVSSAEASVPSTEVTVNLPSEKIIEESVDKKVAKPKKPSVAKIKASNSSTSAKKPRVAKSKK